MDELSGTSTETINVWNVNPPQPVEQTGWANFDVDFNLPEIESNTDVPDVSPKSEESPSLEPTTVINDSNEDKDIKSKTVNIEQSSLENPVNIADTNANHTYLTTM